MGDKIVIALEPVEKPDYTSKSEQKWAEEHGGYFSLTATLRDLPHPIAVSHAREVMDIRERENVIQHRRFIEDHCETMEALDERRVDAIERCAKAEERKATAYERIAAVLEKPATRIAEER